MVTRLPRGNLVFWIFTMMTQEDLDISVRNINTSLDVLGGKWKIKILGFLLFHDKRGFNELLRDLTGISQKVLSSQLKELERDELVVKEISSTTPIRVTYFLSEKGLEVKPVLVALCNWAQKNYF